MARLPARIAIAAALLLVSTRPADACSCRDSGPPCQAYWTTDIIFRGRAESIGKPADRKTDPHQFVTVRFTVLEPLKGVEGTSIDVRTPTGPASCALRFRKGREYVVHASRVNGVVSTSACSRTRRVERATEDLAYARAIRSGSALLGRISGRVVVRSRSLWTASSHDRPAIDVPVTLRRGDDFAVMVRTGKSGDFAVNGLEAGTYSVTVEAAGRFRIEAPGEIALADARGCAVLDIGLYPDGLVTGHVRDARGDPVRGLTVDLTVHRDDSAAHARTPDRLQAITSADGSYEFTGVPAGRFVVGIDSSGSDVPLVFHPGVTNAGDAAVVDVPAGGEMELPDLVIPSAVGIMAIEGVVLDPDRAPVKDARVYLRGPGESDYIVTAPVLTDFDGRFTIAALAGSEYLLFAERPSPDARGRVDSTDLIRIAPGAQHRPVVAVLRSLR